MAAGRGRPAGAPATLPSGHRPVPDPAAAIALSLPETTEEDRRGSRTWKVRDKTFAWERSFTEADLRLP